MRKIVIVCDICGKKENYNNPYRKEWFIETTCRDICSQKCFDKYCENKDSIECKVEIDGEGNIVKIEESAEKKKEENQ